MTAIAPWPTNARPTQRTEHYTYATTFQSIYDTVQCAKGPIARSNKHKYIERMCWFGIENGKSVIMCEVRTQYNEIEENFFRFSFFFFFNLFSSSSVFVCRRIECVTNQTEENSYIYWDSCDTWQLAYATCALYVCLFGIRSVFFTCSASNNFLAYA